MLQLLLLPSSCRQLKLQETRGLQEGKTIYIRTDCMLVVVYCVRLLYYGLAIIVVSTSKVLFFWRH